jgi:hypothetical protein
MRMMIRMRWGKERKLKIEQRKIVIVAKCFCGNYSMVAAGVKAFF